MKRRNSPSGGSTSKELLAELLAEAALLGTLEAAREEIRYLRQRCAEEGVAVADGSCFVATWSPVSAGLAECGSSEG